MGNGTPLAVAWDLPQGVELVIWGTVLPEKLPIEASKRRARELMTKMTCDHANNELGGAAGGPCGVKQCPRKRDFLQ